MAPCCLWGRLAVQEEHSYCREWYLTGFSPPSNAWLGLILEGFPGDSLVWALSGALASRSILVQFALGHRLEER
jgi:hypothetical protein